MSPLKPEQALLYVMLASAASAAPPSPQELALIRTLLTQTPALSTTALAVEVAMSTQTQPETLHFLTQVRHTLKLDKLTTTALETAALIRWSG